MSNITNRRLSLEMAALAIESDRGVTTKTLKRADDYLAWLEDTPRSKRAKARAAAKAAREQAKVDKNSADEIARLSAKAEEIFADKAEETAPVISPEEMAATQAAIDAVEAAAERELAMGNHPSTTQLRHVTYAQPTEQEHFEFEETDDYAGLTEHEKRERSGEEPTTTHFEFGGGGVTVEGTVTEDVQSYDETDYWPILSEPSTSKPTLDAENN
jgi:hypothetical protein